MRIPGAYVGGIAVLTESILKCWDLPYNVISYNSNVIARDYGSVNKLNFTNVRKFLKNAADLFTIVRRERPAIVHFHTSRHLALLKDLCLAGLLRLLGCKVVGHVHHASYQTLLVGRSDWFRKIQLRLISGCFNRVILMSESIRNELKNNLTGSLAATFQRRSAVIYNFAELPQVTRSHDLAKTKELRVFFIGNVGRQKGVLDLIEAVALLRKSGVRCKLVLAGPADNALEEQLVRQTIERNSVEDHVQLTGPVSGAAKHELFLKADIFALPSYAEGVPISILEAMAYALPVIATNVGGIPEVLTPQSGIQIQAGDVHSLAAGIRTLLDSADLRERLGKKARSLMEERFSSQRFLRDLQSVYDSVSGIAPVSRFSPHRQPVEREVTAA